MAATTLTASRFSLACNLAEPGWSRLKGLFEFNNRRKKVKRVEIIDRNGKRESMYFILPEWCDKPWDNECMYEGVFSLR